MTFRGFTIPDGAFLPPELIYLLPHISEAKLKVLIAVIYHNTQIGGGEPLSLTDIERISGLSRQSVITATRSLVDDDGMLERQKVGNSFTYTLVVKVVQNLDYPAGGKVVKNLDQSATVKLSSESESLESFNSLSDSLNSGGNGQNFVQTVSKLQKLRSAGVYLKTAQALADKFDEETIDRHLGYYRTALENKMAQGPGWLVSSLKENWPAPLGSDGEAAPEDTLSKYTGGEYGAYVQH